MLEGAYIPMLVHTLLCPHAGRILYQELPMQLVALVLPESRPLASPLALSPALSMRSPYAIHYTCGRAVRVTNV